MKHNNLRAIAHNFTDSFASGIGLLIGVYVVDVFGEISNTPEGYIKIDFLNGNTTGGNPSETLVGAITLYCDALPDFCIKHGENVSSFNRFVVSFTNKTHVPQTLIEIEDIKGRYSQDTYIGYPLMRGKVIDKLGRIRKSRS